MNSLNRFSSLKETHSKAAALLHADRPTDGLMDMTKLIGAFSDYARAPNNILFGRHHHLAYVSVTK